MSRRSPLRFVSIAALGVSLGASPARADVCPTPEAGAAAGAIDSQERLDFLARAFDREVRDLDAWSWTWGSVYAAGAIAEGALLPITHDRGSRVDLTVGLISTAFGALSLYVLPLKLTLPLRAARRRWHEPDPCAVLANAEATLVRVEKNQALANGALAHIGNVAVNAAIALILGLGYGRWTSAAISGGAGVAIGEANAFTQPHHLREVLERYRSGRLDRTSPPLAWTVVPLAGPAMAGAALHRSW